MDVLVCSSERRVRLLLVTSLHLACWLRARPDASIRSTMGEPESYTKEMGYSQISLALRLVEVYRTVRVRAPVRPNIDTVLCGLLEVEEHAAPEDAEKCNTAERGDESLYRRIVGKRLVSYDGEYCDEDGSERESACERCGTWKEAQHSMKYIA